MALYIHTNLAIKGDPAPPTVTHTTAPKKPVQSAHAPFASATTIVEAPPEPVVVHQPKIETGHTVDELLVNEYITLHKLYQSIDGKAVAERMDAIKKTLQSIANDQLPADQIAIFEASEGEVEFSKRTNATTIDTPVALMKQIVDQFGYDALASAVKISVTDVKKLLSEAELNGYVSQGPGHRTLKSVRPA